MKSPLLYLGLIGFDDATEAALCSMLNDVTQARRAVEEPEEQRPIWRVADVLEADAVLVRGAGVSQVRGRQLQFLPALHSLRLSTPSSIDLCQMHAPFALSDMAHLHQLGFAITDLATFSLDFEASLLKALQLFEKLLRTTRSLHALAVELTERRQELDADHTYHVEHHGSLDALIDIPRRRVYLRPSVRPADISHAAWLRRPGSANFAPSDFLEFNLIEIGWMYALRHQKISLPDRYLHKPIYIKHNPHIRGSLLHPRHSVLIDLLWRGPHTIKQLSQERPELKPWLMRDIYSLYLTRCISTQKPSNTHDPASSLPAEALIPQAARQNPSHLPTNTISAELS